MVKNPLQLVNELAQELTKLQELVAAIHDAESRVESHELADYDLRARAVFCMTCIMVWSPFVFASSIGNRCSHCGMMPLTCSMFLRPILKNSSPPSA